MTAARPILMSGPMVRATLAGTKSQTRRGVKFPTWADPEGGVEFSGADSGPAMLCRDTGCFADVRCRYGKPGDLLWVRETWQKIFERDDGQRFTEARVGQRYARTWFEYAATSEEPPPSWRPSIHMPRRASRLTLPVLDIRVERLQEISEADAIAEGVEGPGPGVVLPGDFDKGRGGQLGYSVLSIGTFPTAVDAYRVLWESINGAGSWATNPWVWVVTFDVIKLNVGVVLNQKAA